MTWLRKAELGWSLVGGIVAMVALFGMAIAVGSVAEFEALRLIEGLLPTARFLASSTIAAAATVLALLLTLLGLSITSHFEFGVRLYRRAQHITVLSVATIVVGVAVLLAVAVPIGEVDGFEGLYELLYYILVAAVSVLGGLMVTIGLMISATLFGLIDIGHPEGSSTLLAEADEETDYAGGVSEANS